MKRPLAEAAMHPPRAVIFDWDNTLVDTFPVIHAAYVATQQAMGVPPWTEEETRLRVRKSLRDHFPILFGDRWEEAREIYFRSYGQLHLERLRPMPGAERALKALGARLPLAVVSNKTGTYLRREAEHLGWNSLFHRLVGATDAARDKPAADPVRLALDGLDVPPGQDVWFVGDADIDLECAHNAGCVPVLVRPAAPEPGEFGSTPPAVHVCEIDGLIPLVVGK